MMNVCIWILFVILTMLYHTEPKHIPKLSTPNIPNANKAQVAKTLKRGVELGGSIGSSFTLLNEMISYTDQLDIMKAKMDHKIDNKIDMSNPIKYTIQGKISDDQWSYYKLLKSILHNDIIGVSIHQDGKYAYAIECSENNIITSHEIHKVITIPAHINELIDKLIQYDINFDVFT